MKVYCRYEYFQANTKSLVFLDLDSAKEEVGLKCKGGKWQQTKWSWVYVFEDKTHAQIFEFDLHMPEDPIKKLAVLILAGDPQATDLARDILKS